VAMCVNDLICNNGTPMFFLDYYATGKLLPKNAKDVVAGIAEGCRRSECALVGGETAEMPGMYSDDDFDLAGFAVGIAERSEMDTVANVKEGQVLIAMPSSGVHSNGYSLVRKIFFDKLGMSLETEFEGKPLVDTLLEPTRIYVKEYKANKQHVKALAHITGGGLKNIPRINPDYGYSITAPLPVPEIFRFIQKAGNIEDYEMYRTFNMGMGFVLVADEKEAQDILSTLKTEAKIVGEVVPGKGVDFQGMRF